MVWVIENWELILGAMIAVSGAGLALSKLTKTPKDDQFFRRLLNFFLGMKNKKRGENGESA